MDSFMRVPSNNTFMPMLRISQVYPFSMATKSLFDTYYERLILFDPSFTNPYYKEHVEPSVTAAHNIIVPLGLQHQKKEDVAIRNSILDSMLPVLEDAGYKIEKCISAGTIHDSLSSFCLSELKENIKHRSFNLFSVNFSMTIAKITANQTVLTEQGFTTEKTKLLSDTYTAANDMQTNKIDLRDDISSLTIDNQIILKNCINVNKTLIKGIMGLAKATNDNELKKKATIKAILHSVSPPATRKPYRRNIKPGASIIISSNLNSKNILQITLLTDVSVTLCRTPLKTDICTSGIALKYNTLWDGKKTDILGSGEYIQITNLNHSKKAIVLVFKMIV